MNDLQPKESLAIIESIIYKRRQKYEQNGIIFIFWGILIALSGIINFVTKDALVWAILMPLMSVFTAIYFYIKGKDIFQKSKVSDWSGFIWLVAGICALLTGFTVPYYLINVFVFLPFVFACLTISLQLKNKLWVTTSLLSVVLVYLSFYIEMGWYSALLASLLGILLFLIPGIQLYISYKKAKNV